MALIGAGNYTGGTITGQYAFRNLTSVNTRASHTIMMRVKHDLTTTTYASVISAYISQTVTWNPAGSIMGRTAGGAGTSISCTRLNDTFSPTVHLAVASGCYGNTSTWYHIAQVYDATGAIIRTYVDGVASGTVASATGNTPNTTANQLFIGLHDGKMADFAFFSRALSPSEVADMANYRVPQVTSGLVCFCRLDANGNDTSGNGNNLTVAGSAPNITWSTADNPPQPETPTVSIDGDSASASTLAATILITKPAVGAANSASTLAGTLGTAKPISGGSTSASTLAGALATTKPVVGAASSASSLAAWLRPRWGRRVSNGAQQLVRSASAFPATSWTFMTWVRPISIGTDTHTALFQMSGTTLSGARIGVRRTSGALNTYILGDDNTSTPLSYQASNDGNWHHLAVTYDGTTFRAYVDGSLVDSATGTSTGTINFFSLSASASTVAEFAHTKAWSGVALDAGQISSEATYYTPHVANAQLYAWWQLSWQDPTLDSSGNGNALTDNGSLEAQTESPGLPLLLVAGDSTSSSTLSGALSQAHALVGSSTSVSTLSAVPQVLVVGAASSASTLGGSANTTVPIAGSMVSSSTLGGTLVQTHALVGVASSASTFSAAATAQLAGASTSASSLSGTLGIELLLTGDSASASTLSGNLGTAKPLAGSAVSASTFDGTVGVPGVYVGNSTSASTLAGALDVELPVVGESASSSTFGGTLSVELPIAGNATSASTLSGDLLALISGASTSASSLDGNLNFQAILVGDATSSSTFSGTLEQGIVGTSTSASTLSGQLRMAVAGTASSASTLSGTLSIANALVGAATSASTFGGAMTGGVPVSGGAGGGVPFSRRMFGALGIRRRIR